VENAWCVDAGLDTPVTTPSARIFASAASGNGVTFTATAGVFSSSTVNQILRMSGGIATITGYINPQIVVGNWNLPCGTIPNDPSNTPIPQPAGSWSLSFQVTKIYGLLHLIGRQIVGLADGVPIGPFTVASDGSVTLPFQASIVRLGLAFTPQLMMLYPDVGQPTIQGRRRAVYAATARVAASSLCEFGLDQPNGSTTIWAGMTQAVSSNADPQPATYISPGGQTVTQLFDGDVRVVVSSRWNKRGQVALQQILPLPLNVVDVVPEFQPGDTEEIQIRLRQPQNK
jgi:hypothetical protein